LHGLLANHSTSQALANRSSGAAQQDGGAAWAEYRLQADRPDRFTRWMLERTLALLIVHIEYEGECEAIQQMIELALLQSPMPPPKPVDPRLDLLSLELSPDQAKLVLAALDDTSRVELDELQSRRTNPWGGFREAWLEHYNHRSNSAGEDNDGRHTG